MKKQISLILFILFFFGNYVFASNINNIENKNFNNLAFDDNDDDDDDDCPDDVTNVIDDPTSLIICVGATVSFTGTFNPTRHSTIQWQYNSGSGWTDIDGANKKNYTTDALTVTTSFRRIVNYKKCATDYISDPKEITVTVPTPPTIDVSDECGQSVLTATGYEYGATLKWSNGQSGESLTVTQTGTFTVIQTVNGCASAESDPETANPKTIPAAPDFSVTNNCDGTSTLTATDYESGATLSWSTGETSETITINSTGDYSLTQTIDGCESEPINKNAAPKTAPTLAVSEENDPTTCGGQGSIQLSFSNVPNGSYDIEFDGGTFSGITVNSGLATVSTDAGTFNNLKITVNGCTSADGINASLSDLNPPAAPTGDQIQSFCSSENPTVSDLIVNGTNIRWYNNQKGTTSIPGSTVLVDGVTYYATQTVGGCESSSFGATAEVIETPSLSASGIDATACGGLGSINFTFTNVPNGTYTISFDGGVFSGVSVSGGTASVIANAGNYNNLTITVNKCTSVEGKNVTIEDPDPPAAPTGDQNQSFCSSDNPGVSDLVVNGADIKWYSNEAGTNSISVSTALIDGTIYYATQTVGGCESPTLAVTAEIVATPTISASGNNPLICGGLGSMSFTFTNVPNGIYTISYETGSFPLVTVLNNSATILTSSGTYNNLKITVNGCTSVNGVNVALVDPNAPDAPTIIVENLCGESVLTADNYEVGATLNWSTGETGQSITVTEAKTYSLYQELNGCISDAATAAANSKPIPSAPDFSVTDNCDGTLTLTSTDFESGATLSWSTGEMAVTITVNSAGDYSLTQTVDGCESESTTKTAAPKPVPAMLVFKSEPEVCGGLGELDFTFNGVPNGIYTIYYDGGSFENVIVSGNTATVSAYAGSYNNLTISVNNCISASGINITLTEPNAPVIPSVIIDNRCGESVLTVTNYNESATLIWNTGDKGAILTVKEAGTYSVTQELNGCTSDAASVAATPILTAGTPDVELIDDCGESVIFMKNLPEDTWFVWEFNNTIDSTLDNNIILTQPGEYTVYQSAAECSSEDATLTVNPKETPQPPVSGGDKLICVDDIITKLTAEATITDSSAIIVWYDAETGGNIVLSQELDLPGTITYYAESQYPATGCKSPFRVPVTLSILESAKTLIADTTIIGKPQTNVAVIIFPENLTSYQWYMNKTVIPGATGQYYYIPETDRKNENIFSVQVEIPSGCKASFSYTYSDILRSAILGGTSYVQNLDIPSFKIYPNPTSLEFNISIDTSMIINEPILKARIYSANGVCVSEFEISSPVERIDSRKFSPGIYSVVLYGKQGTSKTKRLVITH